MDPSRGDSRYNINYSMSSIGLTLADQTDIYGNPAAVVTLSGRPPSAGLIQSMGGGTSAGLSSRSGNLMSGTTPCQAIPNSTSNSSSGHGQQRGIKRTGSDCYDDHHRTSSGGLAPLQGLDNCGAGGNSQHGAQQAGGSVSDVVDDNYNTLQNKKSPPANGKKTKGRVKIKMEYIDNKLRRYTTFSKRKTGIMKKAYELSTLTGTQVMLLVASETGHVYTFATRKLQPMITSEAGKQLIQTCLNSPDPPSIGGGDQRMSATGFEETELSYNIADEDSKEARSPLTSGDSDDSSDLDIHCVTTDKVENLGDSTSIECKYNVDRLSSSQPSTLLKHTDVQIQESSSSQINKGRQPYNNQTKANQQSSHLNIALTGIEKNESSSASDYVVCNASALSNISQEVLFQLIQSGHLQIHTEEDGSGHQYVTIPLSSSLNIIKKSASNIHEEPERRNKICSITVPQHENFTSKTVSEIIKRELE